MNPESNISKFQMRNLFGLLAQRNAVDMAEQKFIAEVEKVHSGSAVHFELKKKHAHILVLPNKKVTSLDSLKKYVEQYPINFVIANDENMTQVKRKLSSFDTQTNKRVDVIHYSQLLIDFRTNGHSVILRQITQPELEFFTQQLQISVAHLPKLHVNDPQVMFYGYERGQVVVAEFQCETSTIGSQLF